MGLLLAKWGARQVVITDKDSVLPLIRKNVELNGLGDKGQRRSVQSLEETDMVTHAHDEAYANPKI